VQDSERQLAELQVNQFAL
jgi:hypothetical protein